MGTTRLMTPASVRTVQPEDVPALENWAAEHRAGLASLRAAAARANAEAVGAEERLRAAGEGCPPAFASAVDTMLAAAMDRLDEELDAVRRESISHVASAVQHCNAILVEQGSAPTLVADGSWRESVVAGTRRRPRPASVLWRELLVEGGRVREVDVSAAPGADPAPQDDPAPTDEADPFEEFWRGVRSPQRVRRPLRRVPEGPR